MRKRKRSGRAYAAAGYHWKSRQSRFESCACRMPLSHWQICGCLPAIGSSRSRGVVSDYGVFASMISGASASDGRKPARRMSRSSTITAEQLRNPHPGEILMEEFLRPMELSQTALARAIGVPPRRINEIVLGKRAMSADTDLRLARYFGVSDGFFLILQTDYDLMERRRQIGAVLRNIR